MATQFYFKREWLDSEKLNNWQCKDYINSLLVSAIKKDDSTGIYTIKSEFYLMHCSSLSLLSEVLNELGFKVVKLKNIRIPYFTGSFIKILPFPYTDKRCRKKELQKTL